MRPLFLIVLPLLGSTLLTQTAHAQTGTRTIVSDDAPADETPVSAPVTTPTIRLSYDQLKRSNRADSSMTLAAVRADAASNSGRVLELSGRISGLMTTSRGRTVIFEQEGSTAVFPMSLEIEGSELVSAGQNVRGLFLVTAERGDVVLKPIAFANAPTVQPVLPPAIAAAVNRSSSAAYMAPAGGTEGIIMAPPTIEMAIPPDASFGTMARMSQPQRTARGGGAISIAPAPIPSMQSGDSMAAAYNALARRFNPRLTPAQSAEIGTAIVNASRANSLDPRFLSSIIAVESNFNPYCVSSSGAMGLCQIMPFNLKSLGIRNKSDAWNPTQNIHGAAKMLRNNLNDYRGRPDATLLAVAAYNAGGGAVRRAGYQVPNGAQVQRYVWKVYNQYKALAPELFASR